MTIHAEFRRGTAAQWLQINPVLTAGEPGMETDTYRLKIGNGVTTWINLPYVQLDGTKFVSSPQLYVQATQPLDTPHRSAWFLAHDDVATHTPPPPPLPFHGQVAFASFSALTVGAL